jgi:hypothetical protein
MEGGVGGYNKGTALEGYVKGTTVTTRVEDLGGSVARTTYNGEDFTTTISPK